MLLCHYHNDFAVILNITSCHKNCMTTRVITVCAYVKSLTTTVLNIEDIYFFEVNTKYISSNVLKILVISRVRSTSEIADIFNT